jgi:hypothetical protein
MKEIKLLKSAQIELSNQPVSIDEAIATHRVVLHNSQEIISSVLAIEKQLEFAISFYLLGTDSSKRTFFESIILKSDWCGFSAKRKVILAILNQSNVVEGEEKSKLDTLLAKAMRYRNAFAHGEVHQTPKGVFLKYFEGQPREEELTDAYWDRVQADFEETHQFVMLMLKRLGALRAPAPPVAGAPAESA